MNWITTLVTIVGSGFGLWALIRYIILIDLRIDHNTFRILYEFSKDRTIFLLQEEFHTDIRQPILFSAVVKFANLPYFYLHHGERLLQAGWQGKDSISDIVCFRWNYKKIKQFLNFNLPDMQLEKFGVPVQIATPWYIDKIGSVKKGDIPLLEDSLWKDIEEEVAEVVAGTRDKTGGIFYGPPGNGKTSFVKYLATKYNLPIKIIIFSPEYSNLDIMFMFSQINAKCIVLLEDFDNYFDNRQCIIGGSQSGTNNTSIKFTFDVVLNCLDGVYNTYENVIFIMTVNDINKVDSALKNRPSRFKYVRKFDNPTNTIREKLLNTWSEQTEGLNLDQILRLKEFKELGLSLEDSLSKLELKKQEDKTDTFPTISYDTINNGNPS